MVIYTEEEVLKETDRLKHLIKVLEESVEKKSSACRSQAESLVTQAGRAAMVAAAWVATHREEL